MLASHGFVVVAPRYSLAPESSYPVPTRQLMTVLRWVGENADRFHMDASRIVLAGDSAGAQLAAQFAALITNPDYVDALGISPSIAPARLRGVALCSGIYDLARLSDDSPYRSLFGAVGWAYSGTRDYRKNAGFLGTVSVFSHVTAAFPPTFITVGNADPLRRQSQDLTVALIEADVDLETLFYPENHEPPLPHEYQFELGPRGCAHRLHPAGRVRRAGHGCRRGPVASRREQNRLRLPSRPLVGATRAPHRSDGSELHDVGGVRFRHRDAPHPRRPRQRR